ncbi:piggyBac transposable element-derived protein 2-like isoform X1 [Aphis craccivora]|uniref:PiggyBac transposable element-derived protein 2-like isoform X1 n=1 Tax=Aphis craccivora TaxID=307492 RepID=A0A6G0Y9R0_APHCR|nr:piggyBac transposable element-derived protein 2-like isoform X1 [Aphis craccivora]
MAKHQIQNWLEEIDTEISDYDLSDVEDLEQLLENNTDVLENNDFLENIFDGTDQIFENVFANPEVDDSEIDQNLLDEEPCCSTQSKPKKVIHFVTPDIDWQSCLPNPPTEEYTPLQYFKFFFSDEMFDLIHLETNKYAIQKNASTAKISYSEIQQYVGILVFIGVVKMPATRLYWSNNCRYNKIVDVMSRNRFSTISRYFHVEDNTTAKGPSSVNYDKLHKVRPLLNILQSNMHDIPPEEKHSVDEQMIAFKGRSHLKQYFLPEPGLMYDFEIYQRKGTCPETGLGFSGDIVMALTSELPKGKNFKVYFDNWFSSLQLSVALKERQIFCIGRGSYDFKVETENNISLVRWFDRKSINFLSTYTSVEPLGTCKRWSISDKKFIEVQRPHVVEEYNKFMGGVDLADMLLELYRIDIRSNKWYMRIIFWVIGVCIVNGWLLYRRHLKQRKEKLKMSLLEFQTNIAAALCEVTVTRKRG